MSLARDDEHVAGSCHLYRCADGLPAVCDHLITAAACCIHRRGNIADNPKRIFPARIVRRYNAEICHLRSHAPHLDPPLGSPLTAAAEYQQQPTRLVSSQRFEQVLQRHPVMRVVNQRNPVGTDIHRLRSARNKNRPQCLPYHIVRNAEVSGDSNRAQGVFDIMHARQSDHKISTVLQPKRRAKPAARSKKPDLAGMHRICR